MQLSDRMSASHRYKDLNMLTKQLSTAMQLSDRMPASHRYKGLNKLTKQPNTGMQLSDRMPASHRYKGLNKPTKQHNATTTAEMYPSHGPHASTGPLGIPRLPAQTKIEGPKTTNGRHEDGDGGGDADPGNDADADGGHKYSADTNTHYSGLFFIPAYGHYGPQPESVTIYWNGVGPHGICSRMSSK